MATWRLAVVKLPEHIRPYFDGLPAWANVNNGILRIDACNMVLRTVNAEMNSVSPPLRRSTPTGRT
jgi:hypothetical protein